VYGFLHLLRHSVKAFLLFISSHQLEMSLTDRSTLLKLSFCVVVSTYENDLKCRIVDYRESFVMGCKEMGFMMSVLPVEKKRLLCKAKGCHLWYPICCRVTDVSVRWRNFALCWTMWHVWRHVDITPSSKSVNIITLFQYKPMPMSKWTTRVGTLIVATIYLQLIQNRKHVSKFYCPSM